MQSDPIVIVGIARTACGNLLGQFKDLTAAQLGSIAIKAAIERSQITIENIDAVNMGCVLAAGQGQAPARQAVLGANLPLSVSATTINKMCGSGMKAVMLAHDEILSGSQRIMIAGGMESMSNAPYLLPKARQGYRMGHQQVLDHLFFDGLEDAYDKGKLMGFFADQCAQKYHFSREQQDQFAIASCQRAHTAQQKNLFNNEITPVSIHTKQGETTITQDELPDPTKLNKIPMLKPAFNKEGTVTAANASSISDGAAALVLMRQSDAKQKNLKPLATIVGHSTYAHEPQWFTTAPVGAMRKLLNTINWQINDVDLFEINEAFAVVTLAAMHELNIPHDKVNIHGGACALGHPIGASGARILVTLISALQQQHLKRGIASLCIGGGEATAIAIELI